MADAKPLTAFRLTSREDDWSHDRPGNRRLVCLTDDGRKVAIMGTEDERENMNRVAAVGFPCEIACERSEPKEWQRRVRGYTDVVHARAALRVLGPDGDTELPADVPPEGETQA
jgi:hypothetical protein